MFKGTLVAIAEVIATRQASQPRSVNQRTGGIDTQHSWDRSSDRWTPASDSRLRLVGRTLLDGDAEEDAA